ncbi:MAG: zinc ABC transporter substrate-binding protein [Acetobacteraceae bacterium]|nr:zinc ABC transporter substrate-binding protein [Acetobacteraceae bacterium]
MRRRQLLAGLGLSSALAPHAGHAAPPLRAVATFSILADMVRQVGGASVSVTGLVPPDGDAHVYQPKPADLRAIMQARLLVENGLGLEGWMQRLGAAGSFAGVRVTAAQAVTPRTMNEDGKVATDPHAWQDPRNGVLYVRAIADGLIQADPTQADAYRAAAARYSTAIEATDAWIAKQFEDIPPADRRVITTHDAFGYYGARYGIELLSAEGLSTEVEPSAHAIAALVAQIRREHIHAVFLENMTDPRLARMLAQETGATLGGTVYSDALSPPNGPAATYLAMLHHNTTLFAQAMRRS